MTAIDVEGIISSLDAVSADSIGGGGDDVSGANVRLVEAARKMIARLEPPFMQVWGTSIVSSHVSVALKIVADIGLWEAWRDAGGKEATLTELWDMCKVTCDIVLVRRLLLLITACHLLTETGEDRWRPTATSLALGDEQSSTYQCLVSGEMQITPSVKNFPKFLAESGYQEPVDPLNSNYSNVTPDGLTFFDHMTTHPLLSKSFSKVMSGFAEFRLDWTEIYDINELLRDFEFNDTGKKLLVDIGGSHGLDLERVLTRKPDIPSGYLVLQDLPDVVSNVQTSEKIEVMSYNFLTKQPIVGSRAYLLRAVLHDWDDIDARRILKRIRAAMLKDYSKLLICDVNLPPTGAQRYQAMSDFSMMHLCSSSDRTEKRWLNLFRSADLEVAKIWRHSVSPDSVFEVVLAGPTNGGETENRASRSEEV